MPVGDMQPIELFEDEAAWKREPIRIANEEFGSPGDVRGRSAAACRVRADRGGPAVSRCDLPEGTYVRVTEKGEHARPPYIGRIVGYDMRGSKYKIGARFGGWGRWLFADGGSWAFPGEVEEISEAEATRLSENEDADR